MTGRRYRERAAFTLVELLIVMAIIVILIALLVPAVFRALKYAQQVNARTEISQLDAAFQSFQAKFGTVYIPSQIKLCKWSADYDNTKQLDVDSLYYLTKMFPKLTAGFGGNAGVAPANSGAWATDKNGAPYTTSVGVNWTQDPSWTGVATYPTTGTIPRGPSVTLEGHQCLVFFLGGIQTKTTTASGTTLYGCTGFSTNPLNPSDTTATIDRIPLFFEFNDKRLAPVKVQTSSPVSLFNTATYGYNTSTNNAIFLSYLDPLGGKPYAFCSAYFKPDGYQRSAPTYTGYGTIGDNPTLNGVMPYYLSGTSNPTQYMKPDSFQIICAGYDGQFGVVTGYPATSWPGIAWLPDGSLNPTGNASADDMTNFVSGTLKGGQ
jgi:prepilin-type N-terminal cleavage/methylation domain-containing protein